MLELKGVMMGRLVITEDVIVLVLGLWQSGGVVWGVCVRVLVAMEFDKRMSSVMIMVKELDALLLVMLLSIPTIAQGTAPTPAKS